MKIIAITPDYFDCNDLVNSLRLLEEKGASHVYVRSPLILESPELKSILKRLKEKRLIPIIPFYFWKRLKDSSVICHFKEKDVEFLAEFFKQNHDAIFSVSCHSVELARKMLEKGAEFVFISPVFPPYSKKDYPVNPLEFEEVSCLVHDFGERVALLGGIDFDRLKRLKLKLKKDFSIAGITMFFGGRDFN